MMTNWKDRLSEYLDGELDPAETAALEARLAGNGELRTLLEELRTVKSAALARPDLKAPDALWAGIQARIGVPASLANAAHGRARKLMFTIPQLAIAAGIMLLLGVGVAKMAEQADRTRTNDGAGATGAAIPVASAGSDRANYVLFVDDLEARLQAGRGVLDEETVRVLEQSLSKIDTAIGQARTALENDPNNTYLNQHLASARARKLRLLEDATVLVAART